MEPQSTLRTSPYPSPHPSLYHPPVGPALDALVAAAGFGDGTVEPFSTDPIANEKVRVEIESRGYRIFFSETEVLSCSLVRDGAVTARISANGYKECVCRALLALEEVDPS